MAKKCIIVLLICFCSFAQVFASSLPPLNIVSLENSSGWGAKYGFEDQNGKLKIPCVYDYAENFSEGLALVVKGRKAFFINTHGLEAFNSKTSPKQFISGFKDSRAIFSSDGLFGYINTKGYVAIPSIYEDALSFSEGKAPVKLNGKYGFIDKNGKTVIDFKYDLASPFKDGVARINIDGKYGFIDENGNNVTPVIYERAASFSEGFSAVRIGGKYAFIDKSGFFLTPLVYDWVSDFENSIAIVSRDGLFGFIDNTGEEIVPTEYAHLERPVDGYIICSEIYRGAELFGVMNINEKTILPFRYDSITYLSDGLFLVCDDGDFGVITSKRRYVLPAKYDSIIQDGDILLATLKGKTTKFNIKDLK